MYYEGKKTGECAIAPRAIENEKGSLQIYNVEVMVKI